MATSKQTEAPKQKARVKRQRPGSKPAPSKASSNGSQSPGDLLMELHHATVEKDATTERWRKLMVDAIEIGLSPAQIADAAQCSRQWVHAVKKKAEAS